MTTAHFQAPQNNVLLTVKTLDGNPPHRFSLPIHEARILHAQLGAAIAVAETQAIPHMGASRQPGFSGNACGHCGNFTLRQAGTCQVCSSCGETTGCS